MHWGKVLGVGLLVLAIQGCGAKEIIVPPGMVHVKHGSFTKGYEGKGALATEKPKQTILMEKGFFIDIYEVTNEQYFNFSTATGTEKPTPFPAYWEKEKLLQNGKLTDDARMLPVVNITHAEAQAYAEHHGKRLPTEHEWEYAARGEWSLLYPWGKDWQAGAANDFEAGENGPVRVGKYNEGKGPFGTYDQAGNVWEWTSSIPDEAKPTLHVIKGGSYHPRDPKPRASLSYRKDAGARAKNLGFRCVKDM
ncbi:formylglycine-generating enzyme family protein [Planctomycetota bacterium]